MPDLDPAKCTRCDRIGSTTLLSKNVKIFFSWFGIGLYNIRLIPKFVLPAPYSVLGSRRIRMRNVNKNFVHNIMKVFIKINFEYFYMFFRTGGGRGAGVQPEQEGRGVEARYLSNEYCSYRYYYSWPSPCFPHPSYTISLFALNHWLLSEVLKDKNLYHIFLIVSLNSSVAEPNKKKLNSATLLHIVWYSHLLDLLLIKRHAIFVNIIAVPIMKSSNYWKGI